jgi:hypothetical protein
MAIPFTAKAGPAVTEGPSACSQATYWCKSNAPKVDVCVFNESKDILLINDQAEPAFPNIHITPPRAPGSPFKYSGQGISLEIYTSTADQIGNLNAPQLELFNVAVKCVRQSN